MCWQSDMWSQQQMGTPSEITYVFRRDWATQTPVKWSINWGSKIQSYGVKLHAIRKLCPILPPLMEWGVSDSCLENWFTDGVKERLAWDEMDALFMMRRTCVDLTSYKSMHPSPTDMKLRRNRANIILIENLFLPTQICGTKYFCRAEISIQYAVRCNLFDLRAPWSNIWTAVNTTRITCRNCQLHEPHGHGW